VGRAPGDDGEHRHSSRLPRSGFQLRCGELDLRARFGYTAAELIGRSHFELFPNAENEAIFERARTTGEPVSYDAKPFEFPNQPWRGVTYWDWRLTPVKGRRAAARVRFLVARRHPRRSPEGVQRCDQPLSDVVHSNLDFDWILEQIVPELAAATGCEFVAAALRSPDGQWRFQEVFGLPDDVKNATYEDERLPELAEAVRSERPVLFEEADGPRQATALSLDLGVRSMLVAPLPVPGQQGAIVYGYRSGPGVFDENVVDFSGKIASSLSLALSNSLRFHDAMRAARLSGALAKVDEILLSALTPDDVVARLVDEVSKAAGAKRSLVIEVRDSTYTITHVRGVSEELVGTARDESYYPAFAIAASQRQPVLIEDNWNDPRTNKEFVVPNELRAFQLLPLTAEGRVTHVLALVYDQPRSFHDDDRRSAERMAAAMSLALTNARLYERERRIADRLQGALLALPEEIAGVEFAHAYHAASDAARVGGDFYDIFELDQECVGVTVGDVAGKGLDAAVLTSLVKNTVRAHAHEKGKTPVRSSHSRTMSSTRPPLLRRS
jgi:GAF domain-containing protein